MHNLFRSWGPLDHPEAGGPAIPVNANNYPLAPASTIADLAAYPDGDYQLSYQGTATVSFSGIGSLSGPLVTEGGVTTGTVVIDHNQGDGRDPRARRDAA